jgi:hypothetical protein
LSEISIEKREANDKNHTEVAGKQTNTGKGKAKKKSTDAAGKKKGGKKANKKGKNKETDAAGKKKGGKKANKKGKNKETGEKGKVRNNFFSTIYDLVCSWGTVHLL